MPPTAPRSSKPSITSKLAAWPSGSCGGGSPIVGGGFVFTNTFINPITLSWNMGGGWFVSASFNFTPPDGTRAYGPAAFSFTPNPDYWTFEPALAISYLGPGWVLSGNFFYDINTQSQGTCCAATKSPAATPSTAT